MNPEVSVYCTVKNGAATLRDTLESIAAQRGAAWELVIVDDGSSDATPQLLREFASRFSDGRVKVLSAGSVGRAAALNRAWSACRAPLIANIDADDLFHPDKLALQCSVMRARGDIALLSTENLYIGAGEKPDWPAVAAPASATDACRDITRLLGRFNPVNHSSVVLRRAVIEAAGGYDPNRRRQLDYDLWIRIAAAGSSLHQLDLPLTAKRLHDGQSFEARISPVYIASSFVLQNRAIRALRLPAGYYALSALRVLYRLLPQPIRRLFARSKRAALSRPVR